MWREVPRRDRRAQGRLIKVVLTTSAVVCFGAMLFTPRPKHAWSKADIARVTVKKYALEAYPSWRAHRLEKPCPTLVELNEYMNSKDTIDPWGGHYVLTACTEQSIVVHSCGEDGVHGTGDDHWSDQ